jgi:hypothetical protein
MKRKACPHCGAEFAANMVNFHAEHCPMSPALRERIRAALDDGTGAIVPSARYQANAERRADSLGTNTLFRTFGKWEAVAAWFDLKWENPFKAPKVNYQKAVKLLNLPLDAAERVANIPGEDYEALAYRSPWVKYGPCEMPICAEIDRGREVVYVLR